MDVCDLTTRWSERGVAVFVCREHCFSFAIIPGVAQLEPLGLMSTPWKEIVRQGICHHREISDERVYIVSVDEFDDSRWKDQSDRYRGKTWYVVVFPVELEPTTEELSAYSFRRGSTDPLPTLEDAIRRAEELAPNGIIWHDYET